MGALTWGRPRCGGGNGTAFACVYEEEARLCLILLLWDVCQFFHRLLPRHSRYVVILVHLITMSFIRKVVRNDAIKLDPPEVYNWRVFAIACAVSAMNICYKCLLTCLGLLWWYFIWHGV